MTPYESSLIARKLRNFYTTQNHRLPQSPQVRKSLAQSAKKSAEPGFFKHATLVFLMGSAVFLTEVSLILMKWVRRLEFPHREARRATAQAERASSNLYPKAMTSAAN